MIGLSGHVRVMVATKPVDFRKGAEGLAALVRDTMGTDPFCGAVFVFRAKRADRIKLVYFDGTGVCLFAKRLEDGKFCWPAITDGVVRLTAAQLQALLEGLDWRRVHDARDKAVDLEVFADMIMATIASALLRAYRPPVQAMMRTPGERRPTIKGAVYALIADTYAQIAQAGIGVPPRMLMYRCRPEILRLTGRSSFEDATFVNAVHDFIEDHPGLTADWQLSYDDRGHFTMPGGTSFGLGTQAVDHFISGLSREAACFRPEIRGLSIKADAGQLIEDTNPAHHFGAVCFIEKEGYAEIIRRSRIAERFDVAFASTKGLPNTAIRKLLDTVSTFGIKVFCLHDFDIAGLTIANTLATSNRRYQFTNELAFIDMGLRLAAAEVMGLQSEPFEPDKRVRPDKLRERLKGYGATAAEIRMLVDEHRRIEIDAMADPIAVVGFIEAQLTEHGVGKIVPDDAAMAAHFQQAAFDIRLDRAVAPLRAEFEKRADQLAVELRGSPDLDIAVPPLGAPVRQHLAAHPTATWRQAVAAVAATIEGGQGR